LQCDGENQNVTSEVREPRREPGVGGWGCDNQVEKPQAQNDDRRVNDSGSSGHLRSCHGSGGHYEQDDDAKIEEADNPRRRG
jgi:hypothetical protein